MTSANINVDPWAAPSPDLACEDVYGYPDGVHDEAEGRHRCTRMIDHGGQHVTRASDGAELARWSRRGIVSHAIGDA
jgi:hypothetical protein